MPDSRLFRREKSFSKLMSTIDKQTLAFKELKGGLKDGDPQIKTCDAELAVLEASKNTLMGALVTNGVLPRSSGRRLDCFPSSSSSPPSSPLSLSLSLPCIPGGIPPHTHQVGAIFLVPTFVAC